MGRFKKVKSKHSFAFVIFAAACFFTTVVLARNFMPGLQVFPQDHFPSPVQIVQSSVIPRAGASHSASISGIKKSAVIGGRTFKIPILTFHYIGQNPNPLDKMRNLLSTPPEVLEQYLSWLEQNGYTTVALNTLAAHLAGQTTLPLKSVILTFDDGYVDFYQNAYPVLLKHQARATMFLIVNFIDKPGYLTWIQIEEMKNNGLVSFESHTLTHPRLSRISADQQISEITESKKILEQRLGRPVNFFAYPYGDLNNQVASVVKNAGYVGAVTTAEGNDQPVDNLNYLRRMNVSGPSNLTKFIEKVTR